MSRPERIITKQELQTICSAYLAGTSINNLQKQTKLQKHKLKQILTNQGILVLSAYEQKQQAAELDVRNYFDELNTLQCYVLGLIFGDGCVYYDTQKYKYAVTITSNDLDILKSTQNLFGEQFSITKRKTSNAFNLVINSKHLCEELISKFQLRSPKSNSLIWPTLPKEMYSFFISGLLSTDGCIKIDNRRTNQLSGLEFSYSTNCYDFALKLQNHLIKELSISKTKIKENITKRKNTNYSIRYTGTQAKIILDYIYQNTTDLTRCKRKYDLFTNHLACVSNSMI